MPRTKVVKKRRATQDSVDICDETLDISQDKKKDLHQKIHEFEECIKAAKISMQIQNSKVLLKIRQFYANLDERINAAGIGNLTLRELRNLKDENKEICFTENYNFSKPKSAVQRSLRKRSNSCNTRGTSKKTPSVRSSSCDRSNRNTHDSETKFKTPLNRPIPNIPMVTPKVNPNQPMAVLRRPRMGEMAISMSGSPLMVSSVSHDEVISVSIPLPDGRILSILPTEGIDAANLSLDNETRLQLKKLRQNLTKCLQK